MTVNNHNAFNAAPAANSDGIFNWDFLNEAFKPTKIQFTDFDAVVERKGKFIVVETKRDDNVVIPQGQIWAFEALVKTGVWTVIILPAKCEAAVSHWECWWLSGDDVIKKSYRGNGKDLTAFVKRWFVSVS